MLVLLASIFIGFVAPPLSQDTPGVIHGQVVEDETGVPMSGADVTLISEGRSSVLPTGRANPKTITDDHGRFQFDRLAPGRYRINVQKVGYTGPGAWIVSATLDIGPTALANPLELRLKRGGAISGRVEDAGGEPLRDVTVHGDQRGPLKSGGRILRLGQRATTNDLGEFTLHSLVAGDYYIMVPSQTLPASTSRASAASKKIVRTFFPGVVDLLAAQPVSVTAGHTTSDVVFRVAIEEVFEVSGVVTTASGAPVAEATVRLVAPMQDRSGDGAVAKPPPAGRIASVRTDEQGAFRIAGMPAGSYILFATAPRLFGGTAPGTLPASGAFGTSTVANEGQSLVVETETDGRITRRYDERLGTRLPLEIGGADLTNLRVVVGDASPR